MSDRAFPRRQLLRSFLPEIARPLREGAEPSRPRRVRPPGAVPENRFLELCNRCGDCLSACPESAILKLADWVGLEAGTPVMVPDRWPCLMCDGFPCAAACEPGALEVPGTSVVKLGHVRLDPEVCLPYRGPECGACGGLCPEDAPALRLSLGRPSVDAEVCTGCGRCVHACPSSPKALTFLPATSGG